MEKHTRELWDYLRDYGASNIRIEPGSKHQRIRFEYGGIDRSYTLAHKPSTDFHAVENTKKDLRRMLGPPVPAEEKQPRKLEEMMDDLNQTAAMIQYVAEPHSQVAPKPAKIWQVWMSAYTSTVSSQVYIQFEEGIKQVLPEDVKIERLDDEHWKVSPGGEHSLYAKGSRVLVSYNDKEIKPFGSTKAEAVEADGAILVYLPVEKRAAVAPPKGSIPWPSQIVNSQQSTTKPIAMPINPQQPAVPTSSVAALTTKPIPAHLEDEMRDIIRSIQGIEATCPYRLVRLEGGRIQWRAPVIE